MFINEEKKQTGKENYFKKTLYLQLNICMRKRLLNCWINYMII